MLYNYLKVAWRNFWRDKYYSAINLIGFAVGLSCCALILLYITDELSYDKFHVNKDRLYRIEWEKQEGTGVKTELHVPAPLAKTLQQELPEVEAFTWLRGTTNGEPRNFKKEGNFYKAYACQMAPAGLNMFTLPLINGDKATALDEPDEIIINEAVAKKLFPGANPVGQTLEEYLFWSEKAKVYKIGGVMRDMPAQSHFPADILVSTVGGHMEEGNLNFRGFSGLPQYLLLKENTNLESFTKKMNELAYASHMDTLSKLTLRNIQDIHLYSHTERELGTNGDIKYIYIFSFVALFILMIACINYINLATARSLKRAKEVGIRKTLGAQRGQLIGQFFAESLLVLVLAVILAQFGTNLILPFFNNWAGKDLSFANLPLEQIVLPFSFIFTSILLITTLYPAFYVSRHQPAFALRGILKNAPAEGILRNSLVVVQFGISIFIIIATLIINQQLTFISNKNLGFNKESVLVLPKNNHSNHGFAFRQKLLQHPDIEKVSISDWSPGELSNGSGTMNDSAYQEPITVQFLYGDEELANTLQLNIIKGRYFSKDFPGDIINYDSLRWATNDAEERRKIIMETPIILNQQAVKALGLKNPIGQQLLTGVVQGKVIGVVENFHLESLHHKISSIIISYMPGIYGETLIRFRSENLPNTIQYIERTWKELYPESPFSYTFVDDNLERLYLAEQRMQQIFFFFAFLGIGIACLGLLGLTAYAAERRQKEISIRKVFGATVQNIISMLAKDFLKLVLIAGIITLPFAWWLMNRWLQSFAYRIDIQWWIFAIAGFAAVAIAVITVSFQAIRAAVANPVESLKNE